VSLTVAALIGAALPVVGGGAVAGAAGCSWMDASKPADQRAHELLAAMSLDDKIAELYGRGDFNQYGTASYIPAVPALCIPEVQLNDAGAGVGDQQVNTTAFPAGIAQAASWDPALQEEFGRALGSEAWHKGINVQLAPGVNIARVPMNGRNFEYAGEDPYLSGQGAAAEILGIQQNPVIATVKHYALNSQETNRMSDSSDVDERTAQEVYLPAFETAVKQGHVGSVMCSYNRINSVYACENPTYLTDYLKKQFGFTGFVMSDWGGTHSTVPAANSGLDVEMNITSGTYFSAPLKAAVQAGQVSQQRLDDMVLRLLRPMFAVGLFDHAKVSFPQSNLAVADTPQDAQLALRIAENGAVLLKNSNRVLPLDGAGKRIAVIGLPAGPVGAENVYGGGGSSHIPEAGYIPVESPLQAITQRALANGDLVTYADGTAVADAVAAASTADIAVVFAADAETEGADRANLSLSNQFCVLVACTPSVGDPDALISAVAAANPNTVVVLNTGGPVVMPWLDQVRGVLEMWYPGQELGNATAALLFGDVNPSGKLPQTFPKSVADLPTRTAQQYPGVNDSNGVPHSRYSEGMLVGYRWYDAKNIAPLFPFGFGLSYTSFDLSGLSVTTTPTGANVSFTVSDTGQRAGAEVAQVYVADPAAAGEPPKQLKGFRKVQLSPGGTSRLTVPLDQRAFSHWDVRSHSWQVTKGCYAILVGSSSRSVPLSATIGRGGATCKRASSVKPPTAKPVSLTTGAGPTVIAPRGPLAATGLSPWLPLFAAMLILGGSLTARRAGRARGLPGPHRRAASGHRHAVRRVQKRHLDRSLAARALLMPPPPA
jgi:beta-glucosidase